MTLAQILDKDVDVLFPASYTVHGGDREPESGLNIDEALARLTGDEEDGPYVIDHVESLGLYAVVDRSGAVVRLAGRASTGGTVDEALRKYMSARALHSRGIYAGPFISTDADYARDMAEAIAADEDSGDGWFLFRAYNTAHVYGYGCVEDAEKYYAYLNAGKTINFFTWERLTKDEVSGVENIEDLGVNLDDELAWVAGKR